MELNNVEPCDSWSLLLSALSTRDSLKLWTCAGDVLYECQHGTQSSGMCILGGFSVALQLCLLDFVCPVACPFQINSKNQKHQRTSVASWPWQVFQPSVPGTVPNITRGNSDSIICRLTITENSKFWDCAYFWSTNLLGVRSTRISTWPQAVQACALSATSYHFLWNLFEITFETRDSPTVVNKVKDMSTQSWSSNYDYIKKHRLTLGRTWAGRTNSDRCVRPWRSL